MEDLNTKNEDLNVESVEEENMIVGMFFISSHFKLNLRILILSGVRKGFISRKRDSILLEHFV